MELKYADLKNGVGYDDYDKIYKYDLLERGPVFIDEIAVELFIIRFEYFDGTFRYVRVYCEPDICKKLNGENEETEFFVKRLFGKDGLIVKEQRNDYIYLGGLTKDKSSGSRYSRFNIADNGKAMQQVIDERLRELLPNFSFKRVNEDWDLFNISYYFHTGGEDVQEVFKKGLVSRFGRGSTDGFCSLVSTFYSVNYGHFAEVNSLHDCARLYGTKTRGLGNKVFIARIPKIYQGKKAENGVMYPPLPTHKVLDGEYGKCIFIPQLIYAVYDLDSNTMYRNPNYNVKYNPNGLSYDNLVADRVKESDKDWYDFMESRIGKSYSELKRMDLKNRNFEQACAYYGISLGPIQEFLGSFKRKK